MDQYAKIPKMTRNGSGRHPGKTAAGRLLPGNRTNTAQDTDRNDTKEAGILRPPRLWNELFIGHGQESQFVGEILDQLAVEQVQHPCLLYTSPSPRDTR